MLQGQIWAKIIYNVLKLKDISIPEHRNKELETPKWAWEVWEASRKGRLTTCLSPLEPCVVQQEFISGQQGDSKGGLHTPAHSKKAFLCMFCLWQHWRDTMIYLCSTDIF